MRVSTENLLFLVRITTGRRCLRWFEFFILSTKRSALSIELHAWLSGGGDLHRFLFAYCNWNGHVRIREDKLISLL